MLINGCWGHRDVAGGTMGEIEGKAENRFQSEWVESERALNRVYTSLLTLFIFCVYFGIFLISDTCLYLDFLLPTGTAAQQFPPGWLKLYLILSWYICGQKYADTWTFHPYVQQLSVLIFSLIRPKEHQWGQALMLGDKAPLANWCSSSSPSRWKLGWGQVEFFPSKFEKSLLHGPGSVSEVRVML